MSNFQTIESMELSLVTGGLEASGEVTTPGGSAKGSVKTDPTAPDPEKQLRCYAQVQKQANWFQGSNKTLSQQLQLCGPLRP